MSESQNQPAFRDALRFWWKLGWISFGGPAGQIAIMHREIVERRRWLSDDHFLHALNFCMLLPGPEAQQLATYLGWRFHGVKGGIAAGALFVLPSVFILMLLSWIYLAFGNQPVLAGIIHGLEPAVIAIVAAAMLKIGKKSLRTPALWTIATLAFIGIFVLKISFVWIILGAGIAGFLGGRLAPTLFPASGHKVNSAGNEADEAYAELPPTPKASASRSIRVIACGLAIWWIPLLTIGALLGWAGTHFQIGLFFSKVAMITFGGAYSVLPYVAQQAVSSHGWLSDTQMLVGLGLAETTPGPLVIVLEFVGFVGGWQHAPAGWSPMLSAILGALITVWAIFVPCFIFIFLGGPYVENLRDRPRISTALTAITAAVVGVILNLAVVFTMAAIWPSESEPSWDWFCIIASVLAFFALTKLHTNMLWVLALCAGAGLLYSWA